MKPLLKQREIKKKKRILPLNIRNILSLWSYVSFDHYLVNKEISDYEENLAYKEEMKPADDSDEEK